MSTNFDSASTQSNMGRIVFLSGPSSSGKTTDTTRLEKEGWLRMESDGQWMSIRITYLKKEMRDDFAYVLGRLDRPTDRDIMDAIHGCKEPDINPKEDIENYKATCSKLHAFMYQKGDDINNALLLKQLDEAILTARIGKNVILDDVPFIKDSHFADSHDVSISESKAFWIYQGFKIEQHLKYVPVDRLMTNVMARNRNPENHRRMLMVLDQYADRFVATGESNPNAVVVGKMKVADLEKWTTLAAKIEFLEDLGIKFDYSLSSGVGSAVEEEVNKLNVDQKEALEKKVKEEVLLHKTMMQITDDKEEVDLTYVSKHGIKATIVKDVED